MRCRNPKKIAEEKKKAEQAKADAEAKANAERKKADEKRAAEERQAQNDAVLVNLMSGVASDLDKVIEAKVGCDCADLLGADSAAGARGGSSAQGRNVRPGAFNASVRAH